MLRLLFIKACLFALPVASVLGLPIVLALHMGEAMPLRAVVALQMGDEPVLYGVSDRDMIFAYKLMSAEMRRADVLLLGSSRVLHFRAGLVNREGTTFYNAGGEAWNMADLRAFLEALDDDALPDVLIVGLDQVWFNADWEDWEPPNDRTRDDVDLARVLATTKKVLDNLLMDDVRLDALIDRREWVRGAIGLGLNAIKAGRGYRNDGSHQEGDLLVNPALGELARSHDLEKAPEGWRQFVAGSAVSEPMLAELDAFLQLAQARGITVIGFGPPFMPSIYDIMMADGEHAYLPESTARIAALFEHCGFAYYDFTDPTGAGGSDEEMYDGWHASELLSLRLYIAMLKAQPDVLGPYSDLAALEQVAATAENPLEVFGR